MYEATSSHLDGMFRFPHFLGTRPMSKQYDERVSCARNSGPIASESSPKTIRARTRARAVRKVSVCPGHATFSPRTRTHACTHTPSSRAGHCVTVTTLSFYMWHHALHEYAGDKDGRATDFHRSTSLALEFWWNVDFNWLAGRMEVDTKATQLTIFHWKGKHAR